jgi:hypothetical protein
MIMAAKFVRIKVDGRETAVITRIAVLYKRYKKNPEYAGWTETRILAAASQDYLTYRNHEEHSRTARRLNGEVPGKKKSLPDDWAEIVADSIRMIGG